MNSNNEQIESLTRELDSMRERYLRLVDLHGELQLQNSLLEDRILTIVETYSTEKCQLEQDLIASKQQIHNLQDTVNELEVDKQRYKDDCNLAVRLLHRHPNEFVSTASEQMKNKNESTSINPSTQSQHSVVIPTFPPTFVTSFSMVNTTSSSPSIVTQTTPTATIATDNLRLAQSLFKSNSVHRYPSTHFICSNCHQTVKCCDVSVQTSLDDQNTTSRIRVVSLTSSDDGLHSSDTTTISLEPHHAHMTLQQYQMGNVRRPSQDAGLPSNSIPQMHHV